MQSGLVQRTPRGRALTEAAYTHLGIEPVSPPQGPQLDMLESDDESDEA